MADCAEKMRQQMVYEHLFVVQFIYWNYCRLHKNWTRFHKSSVDKIVSFCLAVDLDWRHSTAISNKKNTNAANFTSQNMCHYLTELWRFRIIGAKMVFVVCSFSLSCTPNNLTRWRVPSTPRGCIDVISFGFEVQNVNSFRRQRFFFNFSIFRLET